MFAPIYDIVSVEAAVKAVLGDPVRLYPFGEAPQDVVKPYAVWQNISGGPENYLGDRPDADKFDIQVDIYGLSAASVRAIAKALNDALETKAYITRWGNENRVPVTKNYHYDFDVQFITYRQ